MLSGNSFSRRRFLATNGMVGAYLVGGAALHGIRPAAAQDQPDMAGSTETASAGPPEGQELPKWPKQIPSGDDTIVIYQPQVEKWEGNTLEARAAVAVESKAAPQPTLGVIWLSAQTEVDKEQSLVALTNVQIPKSSFPSAPDKADQYVR